MGARTAARRPGRIEVANAGISTSRAIHRNLSVPQLYEHALRRGEGTLTAAGALAVTTGEHTGRSPKDKFVVDEPAAEGVWWGEVNQPLSPDVYETIRSRVVSYLGERELFVQDLAAGADPEYRIRVRLVTEGAWHALFARNLFIVPEAAELAAAATNEPDFTVLHAPCLRLDPARDGSRSETVIVTSFARREIIIAGTEYAGEIKKSIFGVMQYLLPRREIATMHCSANAGSDGDVALFFGLSGTGKTTLSTDPTRTLLGDDEHGWSERGIFNFEGGSYAKTIDLSAEAEPDIYGACHRFGTVLENVMLDPATREIRFDDDSLTENTRAAFPLGFIEHAAANGVGAHPRHVILLTADAFGVLPPVARLSPEQTLYHYLSGYTSKLAGTERGVDEPEATFSACFGSPFLALPPVRYADLLGERLRQHAPACWLINTGWTGGPYGTGNRIAIAHTRAIVHAILAGDLDTVPTETDPIFGLAIPRECPGVPSAVLRPRDTWLDSAAYDRTAKELARAFADNFSQYTDMVPARVSTAGPVSPA